MSQLTGSHALSFWSREDNSKLSPQKNWQQGTLPCRIVPPRVLLGPMLALPPQVSYSALGFQFFPPQAIILPQVFFFATLGYYSTLGFLFFFPQATVPPQVFPFCHPNSALGFLFFPPQATILPQVFSFSHPRLLSCPRFSLFSHPRLLSRPRLVFGREEQKDLKSRDA